MRHFTINEFDCKETGENRMDSGFLARLDQLREVCDFPFHVNSGYRSKYHSKEKDKVVGGTHTQGIAADIRVSGGSQRRKLVEKALMMGFNGIGVAKGFVHVDTREDTPVMWTY